ncbi:DUF6913 domain-containing protein [Winogradskyella litorisediminis]|uniref:DUF6913 domain-containing protein n=1 Tax=Winogradskyella litorisediminis TaxID=1156618 RepID=A0ABW3NAS3_9FLAO
MFLKGLKEKSNQKFIEKTLAKRQMTSVEGRITSVGVLLSHSEFANYEAVNSLLDELNVKSLDRRFFSFIDVKAQQENFLDTSFTVKDFGWRGKLKNTALQDFTNTQFDVLICYFLGDDIELRQIAAMSKAAFKVGISNKDERLYDLIIDVSINNFDVFKTELKKYLTILNKI